MFLHDKPKTKGEQTMSILSELGKSFFGLSLPDHVESKELIRARKYVPPPLSEHQVEMIVLRTLQNAGINVSSHHLLEHFVNEDDTNMTSRELEEKVDKIYERLGIPRK